MLEGLMQHDSPLTLQLVLERMRGVVLHQPFEHLAPPISSPTLLASSIREGTR